MAKWNRFDNPPPKRRNWHLERMGSMEAVCERIVTTYIETGRSVRSLAQLYGVSKSTIGRYINEYARDNVNYNLFQQARRQAKINRSQGADENDLMGSMD